jgi:TPR repeat protein
VMRSQTILLCAIAGLVQVRCEPGAHAPASAPQSASAPTSADPDRDRARRDDAAVSAANKRLDADMATKPASERPCDNLDLKDCQEACDSGKLAACVHLAELYMQGQRVPRDVNRGGIILREACDAGSVKGCYEHGIYFQSLDPVKAAESLVKVCSGDGAYSPGSCSMYLAMVDRHAIAPSRDDLLSVVRRACEIEKSASAAAVHGACDRLKDIDDAQ